MLPLDGVRVIDCSHDLAGPHAGRLLGDLGADVVRIEYAKRLDVLRGGRLDDRFYDRHPRWRQVNRNKRSLCLDFARDDDRAIFRDLVRVSDVVLDNSRPGVLERHGFGWADLSALTPDLVMVVAPAFGSGGPESAYAGYGASIEAMSGIQTLTAYAAGARPVRVREVDITNGFVAACAVLTGLVARDQTGRGQYLEESQLEATISALAGEHFLEWVATGHQTLPVGNRHPRFAPHGCYPCAGETWVTLAVQDDAEWPRFCGAIGRPDLAEDPALGTAAGRAARHDELDAAIAAWTATRSPDDAMVALQAAGIAAGAVRDQAALVRDPHLVARGWVQHAQDGSGRFPGPPFRFDGEVPPVRRRGPLLAEHQREIVCDLLGRPESDVRLPRDDEIRTAYE